jgi:phasin family protein
MAMRPDERRSMRMIAELNEFLEEQTTGLAELARRLRQSRAAVARKAAAASAARVRSLNGRVRSLARSGVRLTSISQATAQSLIELQAEIVTDALTDAAEQMQRIVYTSSVRDLAREHAGVLQAAQQRIVNDIARAVTILKGAAGDVRKVASSATAAEPVAPKKPARRKPRSKVARKAGKAKRPVRRAKAKARAKGVARRARRT